MKKRLAILAESLVATGVTFYLFGAFIAGSLDVSEWHPAFRAFIGICWGPSLIAMICYLADNAAIEEYVRRKYG